MDRLLQLSLLALVAGCALAIQYKDCGSTHGKLVDVKVGGCDSTPICNLVHNTNASFSVSFTTDEKVDKATAVVHGVIDGIPVPFPIDHPDACDGTAHIKCPLQPNNNYDYSTNIFVKSIYPKVKLIVKWEVKDQNGKDVFCVEVPAQIVDQAKSDSTLRFNSIH